MIEVELASPSERLLVNIDARDRRAFERDGRKITGMTGPLRDAIQAMPETYMCWLCWHALTRTGAIAADYAEFEPRFIGAESNGQEALMPDPTKPEA